MYRCDIESCNKVFNLDDYEKQPYHDKSESGWSKAFYKNQETKEIKCMIKTSTWKPQGNNTYHYCFDCAPIR